TWKRLPNAKQQTERIKMAFACRVMRIDVVPGSPDQIYAALEVAGVMRSLAGGEHWNDCSADLVTLAEKPNLKSKIQSDSEAEGGKNWNESLLPDGVKDVYALTAR